MEDTRTNKKERLERLQSSRSAARETDKEPSIRLNGGWIPPQASDAYTGTAASLAAFRMKQQQWRLRKATEPQTTWQERCAACPTLSRVLAKRAQRNLEVSSLVQQVEGDRWHDRSTIDVDGRECGQSTLASDGWITAFSDNASDAIENGSGSVVGSSVVGQEFVRMDQAERRHGGEKEPAGTGETEMEAERAGPCNLMTMCYCGVNGSDVCSVCERCESCCGCAVLLGLRKVAWKRSAAMGVSEAAQYQWVSRAEVEEEQAKVLSGVVRSGSEDDQVYVIESQKMGTARVNLKTNGDGGGRETVRTVGGSCAVSCAGSVSVIGVEPNGISAGRGSSQEDDGIGTEWANEADADCDSELMTLCYCSISGALACVDCGMCESCCSCGLAQEHGGGYNRGVAGVKLEAMAQIFRMTKSKGQLTVCEAEGCHNQENDVGTAAAQVSEEEIQLENAGAGCGSVSAQVSEEKRKECPLVCDVTAADWEAARNKVVGLCTRKKEFTAPCGGAQWWTGVRGERKGVSVGLR